MPATPKFVISTDKKSHYRFNLVAANGEIIASSEAYPTKAAAKKGIASVVRNAAKAVIEDTTVVPKAPKAPAPAAKAPVAKASKAGPAAKAPEKKATAKARKAR